MVIGSTVIDIMLALLLALYLIYRFLNRNSDYWDRRGVENTKEIFCLACLSGKESLADVAVRIYRKHTGHRYFGAVLLNKPQLMIHDLKLVHNILVKDFIYFQDRELPSIKKDPFTTNLFFITGQEWRNLRHKLTTTFTTGKLKGMFDQILNSGENMMTKIKELSEKNTDFECKTFILEFTSDVIARCAFGLQFQPNSAEFEQFQYHLRYVFKPSIWFALRFVMMMLCPKLASLLNFTITPKENADYFVNLATSTLKYRKDKNFKRNDYFQLLMTLKEQEDSGKVVGLSMSDITEDDDVIDQMEYTEQVNQHSDPNAKIFSEIMIQANAFIFLVAGTESVSGTVSFVLYELARHPDVQKQLQHEVDSVLARHKGSWSYQAIKEMIYLDQVIQESQRLYPVLPILQRKCVKPYAVPGSELVIEKGVLVNIPVIAIHKDPRYYPEPDKFKPDRFEGNNFKPKPSYLPYGDGPRICIAMRFAVMEMKTCVAKIMSQYSMSLSPKTKLPLQLNTRTLLPVPKDGIWLVFEKRKTKSEI